MTEFLRRVAALASTGDFAGLHVGASLPELAARHGDPWDCGGLHKGHRWPHAFGWGDAWTVFCSCRRLSSFSLPAWHGELELPKESAGLETLDTRIGEAALTAALTEAGCRWETVTYTHVPGQRTLELEPVPEKRVGLVLVERLDFDEPPFEDWLLYSVGLWSYDHPDCPKPDRALPDDGWGAAGP
ncbi:hypothetical protein [Streptomyces sp. NRRL WC-3742]|uniref:hypothetical protein n=1 Tax=Streptomyces sp. NRRL WC-3742 TaxID=1463934 RepID=UPI0004C4D387|nr:hypothetical protein [Streptomyces sp. NRRL WC-3742]